MNEQLVIPKHLRPMQIIELIKLCPGGRHAWFKTTHGVIRKPVRRKVK